MKTISTILAAAVIFGAAQVSNQAITATYFGEDPGNGEDETPAPFPNAANAEASFLSALTGGAGTENFETFANGSTSPLGLTFPGAGSATLGGDGQIRNAPINVGRFAISGSNYWDANTSFTISFGAPVAAFGFYGVDIGDFNGRLTLAVNGVSGNSLVVVPNSFGLDVKGGGILYFGYINTDNPFTSITFGNTTSAEGVLGDAFAFDDMTIGSVEQVVRTPEVASSLMLLGMAVGGLSIARRFKA